jgi:hypothetical protein
MSVGSPHTFYDYIVAPTDWYEDVDVTRSFNHEFGHSLRFVADGDLTHWHWDDFRFNYGHSHGDDLFNKGFSFSEGWAHYWSYIVTGDPPALRTKTHANNSDADLDWDEHRIGIRLAAMNDAIDPADRHVGAKFMMDLQIGHVGNIHTMFEFEEAYCKALPTGRNTFCFHAAPVRSHPGSCPLGYTDDGATCRYNSILAKPSQMRGAGTVPSSCPSGGEYDAGLCYPTCPANYRGVGPVCWQNCPAGYADDGATCRRNAKIISSNNDACPWYDRCGVTFAGGCSVCPAGYHNDGCTCRIDVHIFGKSTRTRGVGSVPGGCAVGLELDAGLCYSHCRAGFHGVGPVCWGNCPGGYADHGATCYRDPHIFSDDPDS